MDGEEKKAEKKHTKEIRFILGHCNPLMPEWNVHISQSIVVFIYEFQLYKDGPTSAESQRSRSLILPPSLVYPFP